MKKVLLLILTVAFLACAATAIATPIYHGPTHSSIGVGNNPDTPTASGYYLWSNDLAKTSWSIRWTGNNFGDTQVAQWFGSIELGTGLDLEEIIEVQFEASNDSSTVHDVSGFGDIITYTAQAGPVWDGIDFTIDGRVGNVIGFNLGSSLFNEMNLGEQEGFGIYISDLLYTPDVLVSDYLDLGGVTQDFEIYAPVPEPGTLALLGLGLLGIGIYGRKRMKK